MTYNTGDRIVLKKLSEPEKGIFSEITEPIREKIKKLGIEKEDIEEAINEARED
ncbi:MAG: IS605 OrfB-like transposable element containing HTH domain [Candidatus Methanohalarchaeum thermophilum]|uniref:IS605 OrfB-like transposable element containing HTH domain n=1 Tax=Methanohalarchaeum thermophilum TaxID=1903181 RepID=A0A1Q6DSU0_METT1|nr:MAG: IS605 OrfB-like transposable element containing HTH domain [Candidatus Methanohalarchaeum thermophilum]